jgi:predicted ferric reductase
MRKSDLGPAVIVVLGLVPLALWLTTNPTSPEHPEMNNWAQRLGEVLATTAMALMACVLALATRPSFLEPFFGGLDRMYVAHKRTALTALTLLLAHLVIIPKDDFFTPGSYMGLVALLGLWGLALLTLAPRLPLPLARFGLHLPYHQWKVTHQFIGLFFLLGLLHSFNVEHLTQSSPLLDLYARGLGAVGVVIYLYKVLLDRFVRPTLSYAVEAVRRLNANTAEVSLKPQGRKLQHRAGQFLFVSFPDDAGLKEAHPFTISSAPHEPNLRLSIKASGDFTQHLHGNLRAAARAHIEGPYGALDYKTGARRQVWVAGGIGVTPFLSWLRDFGTTSAHQIDFFYTVRSRDEAVFADEIEAADRRHDFFTAHLVCSNTDGRLTAARIAEKCGDLTQAEFYLCGPLAMTESLHQQLRAAGVSDRRIHFEEFNFR